MHLLLVFTARSEDRDSHTWRMIGDHVADGVTVASGLFLGKWEIVEKNVPRNSKRLQIEFGSSLLEKVCAN